MTASAPRGTIALEMRSHARRPGSLATLSETFWLLVLGVVVMFAFFAALGAFEVGEALW